MRAANKSWSICNKHRHGSHHLCFSFLSLMCNVWRNICARTCTYTRMHTNARTYAHKYTHTYAHTHTHTHTHTNSHARTHIHTHTHPYAHTPLHTHLNTHTHTHVQPLVHCGSAHDQPPEPLCCSVVLLHCHHGHHLYCILGEVSHEVATTVHL